MGLAGNWRPSSFIELTLRSFVCADDFGRLARTPPVQRQWGPKEGRGRGGWCTPQEAKSLGVVIMGARMLFSFSFLEWGGYLLYREWCLDIFLLSSSLSANKHETGECVLLQGPGGGRGWGLTPLGFAGAPKLSNSSCSSQGPVPSSRNPEWLHSGDQQSKTTCPEG